MGKEFTRHNELFSKIIGDLSVARAFFQAYLPKEVQRDINFLTLEIVRLNSEGVRDTLNKRDIADALFQVSLKKSPAYLLVHAEHQSTINRLTLLRTIQYGITGLLDYARLHPNRMLPPLISLIYYHGQQCSENYPTSIDELFEEKHYTRYLFQPLFINVGQITDEELKNHGEMSGLDLLFKYIFDRPTPALLKKLLAALSSNSGEIQYYALQYLVSRFDMDKKQLLDIALDYLLPEKVMTVAEQLKQEGLEIGMQQGMQQRNETIARNALKEGADPYFVGRITGLSLKRIKIIQAQLKESL